MAPMPTSPQARRFSMGSHQRAAPRETSSSAARCRLVNGLFHICVFIAGAKTTGLLNSHARNTHVSKLSHKPLANLARVFALRGATRRTSAHLAKSMCNTGSPICRHCAQSSSSPYTHARSIPARVMSSSSTNCLAAFVRITLTSYPASSNAATSAAKRVLATLPVNPTNTFVIVSLTLYAYY